MTKNPESDGLVAADKNSAGNNSQDIQILRAVAALLVVVDHAGLDIFWRADASDPVFKMFGYLGALGVYVFFIISGYLMVQTNTRSFGSRRSAGIFLLRRFMRIAPIYYVGTLIAVFFLYYFHGIHVSIWEIVQSYLFVAYYSSIDTMRFTPVLSVGWSLNMEMFFYLIFSIGLLFRKSEGITITLLILVFLVLWGAFFDGADQGQIHPSVLYFYTEKIILLFAFGMLCAVFQAEIKSMSGNLGPGFHYIYILIGALVATIVISVSRGSLLEHHATLLIMLMSALVFVAMLCTPPTDTARPGPVKSLFINVGDASYSIYIFHSLVLMVLVAFFAQIHVDNPAVRLVACTIVPVICSMVLYRLLEMPLRSSVEMPLRRSLGASGSNRG